MAVNMKKQPGVYSKKIQAPTKWQEMGILRASKILREIEARIAIEGHKLPHDSFTVLPMGCDTKDPFRKAANICVTKVLTLWRTIQTGKCEGIGVGKPLSGRTKSETGYHSQPASTMGRDW
ncbi:hypothetical protein SERLA73DRAFT_149091 [Serpula lacrymans var. lacrymans S7.3]|uniref:Uncharacterized protein n=1 Tax=Serpula lacrymans var. lacrymans (strain S7.3) TaxID=936435 RepID=F8PF08_SERL3|nr:hypothetical protein SERLA73DRAFT_149091 [Serpula lacrymans var. lacrymans S7.3]